MQFTVYTVPGRQEHLIEAIDAASVESEIEDRVRQSLTRDIGKTRTARVRMEWKNSGTGRLLTARGPVARIYGHYWVRPVPELAVNV